LPASLDTRIIGHVAKQPGRHDRMLEVAFHDATSFVRTRRRLAAGASLSVSVRV
jgi:hypothetical protein